MKKKPIIPQKIKYNSCSWYSLIWPQSKWLHMSVGLKIVLILGAKYVSKQWKTRTKIMYPYCLSNCHSFTIWMDMFLNCNVWLSQDFHTFSLFFVREIVLSRLYFELHFIFNLQRIAQIVHDFIFAATNIYEHWGFRHSISNYVYVFSILQILFTDIGFISEHFSYHVYTFRIYNFSSSNSVFYDSAVNVFVCIKKWNSLLNFTHVTFSSFSFSIQ